MQWWPITAIDHAVNGSNEGSQQSSPQHQASQAPAQVAQNFKQRSPSHSQGKKNRLSIAHTATCVQTLFFVAFSKGHVKATQPLI